MVDASAPPPRDVTTQLVQVRVPLQQAAEIFSSYDADGRVPIVVLPERSFRLRFDLLILAGAILAGAALLTWQFTPNPMLITLLTVAAVGLAVASVVPTVLVRVPEGVNALLAKRGRYWRTIGSGTHMLPPWVAITHLVTRREVPFEMPTIESPTSDRVRATIETVITFQITDPYRFVYSISASDFDMVLQASCQDAFRQLVHGITSEEVMGLTRAETGPLREALDADIASYGVTISKISITYARPPADFVATEEARQLAVVKRAEQVQQQELALHRLHDAEELERQRVITLAQRTREDLRQQIENAALRPS
jgi:regulator of protease activity HflC (stomatin/prohibitin superfamily)